MIAQLAKYLPWIGRKTVTLPALQTAFDAGTTPQKAAFQSSVSGGRPWAALLTQAPGAPGVGALSPLTPTVAVSTTNPLASGICYAATTRHPSLPTADLSRVLVTRGGNLAPAGVNSNARYIKATCVNYGTIIGAQANTLTCAVMYTGKKLAFILPGSSPLFWLKVDDKYLALSPNTSIPSDGSEYYVSIDFGSVQTHRVEVLGVLAFGGVWIETTGTLMAAPKRGPRVIVCGDSITEGAGYHASGGGLSFVQFFSEFLGWDDVWQSGVGATGYLNTSPGSGKVKLRDRLATDVVAFAPEIVVLACGINDGAYTYSQIQAEIQACVNQLKTALPSTDIVIASPLRSQGLGTTDASAYPAYFAAFDVASANSLKFLDAWHQPMQSGKGVQLPISRAASLGATQVYFGAGSPAPTVGGTYTLPNGYSFVVKTVAGGFGSEWVANIDYLPIAVTVGQVATRDGDAFLTGAGKFGSPSGWGNADVMKSADGTHPTFLGHVGWGVCYGRLFAAAFS